MTTPPAIPLPLQSRAAVPLRAVQVPPGTDDAAPAQVVAPAWLALAINHILDNRLAGIENRVTSVENRLTGVENRVTGVENRLTRVENKVDRLEGAVLRMASDLKMLINHNCADGIRIHYNTVPFHNGDDPTQAPHYLPQLASLQAVETLTPQQVVLYLNGYGYGGQGQPPLPIGLSTLESEFRRKDLLKRTIAGRS